MRGRVRLSSRFEFNVPLLDSVVEERSLRVLDAIGLHLVADVMTHFTMPAPSAPGQPPGVVTGNLRAATTYRVDRESRSVRAGTGPTAPYGEYLEFGTSRVAARPYMAPAFKRLREALKDVAMGALR